MLNHETKRKNQMKLDKELEQIQALRGLGIIWLCLGATNPTFFILGLVFLLSSIVKAKSRKNEGFLSNGGHI